MPAPPPPYSSGRLTPDEAEFACLVPQFVGVPAGAGLLQVVVLAVVGGHRGDGLAQRLLFLGLDEAGLCHWWVSLFGVHSGEYGADVDLLARPRR